MAKDRRERVVRMSVELPLWRALTAYRVLTMVYAILLFAFAYREFHRPWVAIGYFAVLTVWTLATLPRVANAARCTKRFLGADLTVALAGILLTPVADSHARVVGGATTMPSIWTAGSVLAFAIKGGWRWAAFASSLVAVANVTERGEPSGDTIHNVILVWIASIAIGYIVEVARASERTLARALEIEAATRERERLARDIHDSVLQVLAMVQRRGAELGGESAELGRMAGSRRWPCAPWSPAVSSRWPGTPPAPTGLPAVLTGTDRMDGTDRTGGAAGTGPDGSPVRGKPAGRSRGPAICGRSSPRTPDRG